MRSLQSIVTLILVLSFTSLVAQESSSTVSKRIYTTKAVDNEEPIIDGKLDDKSWERVEWGTDFIENDPDENTPPSEQTRFKILYDAKYLYVALQAFDSAPDSIVKRLSRRDGFEGDRFNFIVDSYHDLRTAFIFTTTAAGVKGDEIITNDGESIDDSWNPIWYTKSAINDKGWTAEMKIPLSQLRFGNEPEQVWGLQVVRNYFRANERSVWQRIPAGISGFVSNFGELHGLIGLKSQKQLEIQPFTVLQQDVYPEEPGNTFRDGSDFKLNAGLDAKIGITNDLTLDLTVNPDFGQVEADPAAIALDGFEIFFREQRPFFVENKNIFDFGLGGGRDNLFFSRRIGRSPQGFPSVASGEFADIPQNTTILGAAKFSGKTKNGWSIGILESVTSKEYAKIDNNGDEREEIVEPATNYFVGRVQKDMNERNTFLGGIFTATNRLDLPESLNFIRESAYSGGIDFRHQWKNRAYYVEANGIVSHVKGSPEAIEATQRSLTHLFQRSDAEHVDVDPNKTSLTGTYGKFEIGKQGEGNWRYTFGAVYRSPELELNDIGFLRQADVIRQYANIRWQTNQPVGNFRRLSGRVSQFTTYDFEGNYNRIQYQLNGNLQFNNNWFIDFGAAHKPRIYTNTILRGGPRWRFSQENFGFAFFGTDERKKLRASFGFVYSKAKQNNFSFFNVEGDVTYQPTDALRISIQPQFNSNPSKTQYVTETDFNGTPRYILANIDNQTLSAAIRVNYTINPNLTVQYYGQPFIARGRYTKFKHVTNPIADNLYDRFYQYNSDQINFDTSSSSYLVDEDIDGIVDYSISDPDFSFVQFRSNLVVRWEYIPGSELFLVWSQGITGFVDARERLVQGLENGILDQQPDNTFLIKATYRFVL